MIGEKIDGLTVSVTDVRKHLSTVIKQIRKQKYAVVLANNKPDFVLVDYKEWKNIHSTKGGEELSLEFILNAAEHTKGSAYTWARQMNKWKCHPFSFELAFAVLSSARLTGFQKITFKRFLIANSETRKFVCQLDEPREKKSKEDWIAFFAERKEKKKEYE